jgi:hypothetical protein
VFTPPKRAVLSFVVLALTGTGTARAAVPGQGSEQVTDAEQVATAGATAIDSQPMNVFVSVRIDSRGDDGPVTQTSTTTVVGAAENTASTDQAAEQDWAPSPLAAPAATPATATSAEAPAQASGQDADTDQAAAATALATQPRPVNVVVSVRVNSPGDDGPITQTSTVVVAATAGNTASMAQTAAQAQDVAPPVPEAAAHPAAPRARAFKPAPKRAAPAPAAAPKPAPHTAEAAAAPAPQPASLVKAPVPSPQPAKAAPPAKAHPSPPVAAKQRIWPRTPRELAPLPSSAHLAVAQLVPVSGGARWSVLLALTLLLGAFVAAGLGSSLSFVLRRATRPG